MTLKCKMGEVMGTPWVRTDKGDAFCRSLADRHYTRQSPGHPMFCRPGYNFVLRSDRAAWVWWRPKWEDGRVGTSRRDGLHVIECTLFRNEGDALSSELIGAAVDMLSTEEANEDLRLYAAGQIDAVITGISTTKTSRGRSRRSQPGACYLHAGWSVVHGKRTGRADVWLARGWANPFDGGAAVRVDAMA